MFVFLIFFGVQTICVVVAHELLHYGAARALGLSPSLSLVNPLRPAVVYRNRHVDWKNCLVAIAPGIILPAIGFTVLHVYPTLWVFALLAISNLVNLLPITADGEIVLLSLWNIMQNEKNQRSLSQG